MSGPSLSDRLAANLADAGALGAYAHHHYQCARALVSRVSHEALPAVLPLALIPMQIKAHPAELPQWRRQWIMWSAARLKQL